MYFLAHLGTQRNPSIKINYAFGASTRVKNIIISFRRKRQHFLSWGTATVVKHSQNNFLYIFISAEKISLLFLTLESFYPEL